MAVLESRPRRRLREGFGGRLAFEFGAQPRFRASGAPRTASHPAVGAPPAPPCGAPEVTRRSDSGLARRLAPDAFGGVWPSGHPAAATGVPHGGLPPDAPGGPNRPRCLALPAPRPPCRCCAALGSVVPARNVKAWIKPQRDVGSRGLFGARKEKAYNSLSSVPGRKIKCTAPVVPYHIEIAGLQICPSRPSDLGLTRPRPRPQPPTLRGSRTGPAVPCSLPLRPPFHPPCGRYPGPPSFPPSAGLCWVQAAGWR